MAVTRLGIVAGLCAVVWSSSALAAEKPRDGGVPRPTEVGQQHFALGPQLGFYNPNGVAVRGGFRVVSLELAAGFTPTLLSYRDERNLNPELKLIAPVQLSPQLLLGDIQFEKQIHGSFRVGYRYDFALGHGGTIGGQLAKRWGHLQLEGLWGISVFPDGEQRLRDDDVVPDNTQFSFPPALTWGLTVGLMYYP